MASPYVQNISTGSTDFSGQQRDIDRRRKMAEMLSQDAVKPIEQQTAGGYVVPISPWQGVSRLMQAYLGGKMSKDLSGEEKDLSSRRQQAMVLALGGMPQARSENILAGTPQNDDEGNPFSPVMKTTQPTMADNAGWLGSLSSLGPDAIAMGTGMLGMQQKANEGEENRAARLQERIMALDAASQNAALSREDRAARAKEAADLRREMQTSQQTFQAQNAEQQRQFQDSQNRQSALDRQNLARITAGMAAGNRTPVAVMGPNGPVYVPPSQAVGMTPVQYDTGLQGGLAGAKAAGTAGGKAGVAAQNALPQVVAQANNSLQLIDQMIGSEDGKTKEHPGFQSAVGMRFPGLGMIPGTDTSNFNALLDQVKGGAFLEAYNGLKGGGAITEVEGAKATNAITRMQAAQSEKEFKAAAREYQQVIRAGVERAQQKAGGMAGAAPPGASGLSPAEQQELQQLRQRLGR